MAQSNQSGKRVKPGRGAKGGFVWTTAPGSEDLPGTLSSILAENGRPDGAPADLKSSRLRTVRVIDLAPLDTPSVPRADRQAVVVKEHTVRGPAARIRSWALGHPAAREWRVLRHLHAHGVAVPEPLALGEAAGGPFPARSGVLVLEALQGAVTVEDILLGRAPSPTPLSILARRAGRLLRAMHDARVRHPDLHAANLLASPDGALRLVDFHSARISAAPLSPEARFDDLIPFSGAFLVCAQRTDRLRFFRAYCEDLPGLGPLGPAAKSLEKAAWSRLKKFLKKFDRRPLRSGKAYTRLRIHGRRGMAEKGVRAPALGKILGADPLATLEREGAPIKRDRASSVYSLPFEGVRFVVKAYFRPGPVNTLKRIFGRCRARTAWIAGHRLRARLLPAPQPVLFLADRPLSVRGLSLIVFEEAAGLPTLDQFAERADRAALLRTMDSLARNLARMHTLFLTNRDLKAQNILVNPDRGPVFIDPDGVAFADEITLPVMARDLMRLNASFPAGSPVRATDRLRFLRSYAHSRRLDPSTVRALRAAILERTLAKWARWRRAGTN